MNNNKPIILFVFLTTLISLTCSSSSIKIIEDILNKKNSIINNNNNNNYQLPKTIWLFWEGPLCNHTRYVLHHLKSIANEFNLIFLNNDTMGNYIDRQNINKSLYSLPLANLADYLRFNLIYTYGGVWLDSTVYLRDEEFLLMLYNELLERKGEYNGFNGWLHPSDNIEIGAFMAPAKSKFIKNILTELITAINTGPLDYMKKKVEKDGVIIKMGNAIDRRDPEHPSYNPYFFPLVSIQTVMQKYYNKKMPNIILRKAEEYIFKFQTDYDWNSDVMKEKWEKDNVYVNYPIIKMTSQQRNIMNEHITEII